MNSFTLAMDRREWRVSRNDGLYIEERNACICCTARLERSSGSDGEKMSLSIRQETNPTIHPVNNEYGSMY
jgi:hypothetical protein